MPLSHLHPSWQKPLAPVAPQLSQLLERARATSDILPPHPQILRAFSYPFEAIRVLILGQDPYPNPGDANGLAFSVAPGRPIPASLRNIFSEYCTDLGYPRPASGDLSPWCERGVMLLNTCLTTAAHAPAAHTDWGWQTVTETAVTALNARNPPLVALLWGRHAQSYQPLLTNAKILASPHPSPLSARRGFFGSRPFTSANSALIEIGSEPVHWRLEADPGDDLFSAANRE